MVTGHVLLAISHLQGQVWNTDNEPSDYTILEQAEQCEELWKVYPEPVWGAFREGFLEEVRMSVLGFQSSALLHYIFACIS